MITLRPATINDAIHLYVWRTHPSTQAMMREMGHIRWEDHLRWLRGVLEDPDQHLYVAWADGQPVGSVRFGCIGAAYAEVSVTVSPESRGGGIGTEILRVGTAKILERVNWVEAHIKLENIASQRAFAKAEYTERSRTETEVVFVAKR